MAPFAIAQLTDPHLGATWSADPAQALERAIDTVYEVLGGEPAAILVSGDVANTGADHEYAQARTALERFAAPVYVQAGNHDARDGLRRHFALPPTAGDELSYAVDVGPVRVVALDTKQADSDAGHIGASQLSWLDGVLTEAPTRPTMIVMHHPPVLTGMPAMDAIGLSDADRLGLAETVGRHPQVQLVACGHVHRAIVGRLAVVPVIALPSTDMQLALDLEADEIRPTSEPPCVALHILTDGRFVSHVQPVSG